MDEENRTENSAATPNEILQKILEALKSFEIKECLQAIDTLHTLNYSSEAIRNQLEKLVILNSDADVSARALAALDLPIHRNVRRISNKMDRGSRNTILKEIIEWERSGLLQKQNAEILRRRYDFDITSQAQVPPVTPKQELTEEKQATESSVPPAQKIQQGPPPTLLETLLSEASIKIALYLGAFFVIASALILAVLSEGARLPVLIISTLIFGALAMGIRKRLPQPSFTLFIVFSFLLPITGDVLENSLHLTSSLSAVYWFFISILMAVIWAVGTRVYESRLFSITAFLSMLLAFLRIGNIFSFELEFHTAMAGLASWAGLAGTQAIRKWKGTDFALPLFISAQIIQGITLAVSLTIFSLHLFEVHYPLAWNLVSMFTWASASLFFVASNLLFQFLLFPWLAAAALLPIPWFLGAALDLDTTGNTILFFIWTTLLAAGSEAAHFIERVRSYSLPLVLASIFSAVITGSTGFLDGTGTLLLSTLSLAILYTVLQIIRPRVWLWMFALLNFVIAYFAFLDQPFIYIQNIAFGYELLLPAILFLLPDFFLLESSKDRTAWKLPLRIFGAFFTLWASAWLLSESSEIAAVGFGILTVFFTLYTLAQQKPYLGYIAATYFPLAAIFALDSLNLDVWLPALTGLSILYFGLGLLLRTKQGWAAMLRNSALILGVIVSLSALSTLKETGGWYALVIGLLFAVEMYFSRNGAFEIGTPILFNIGAFLILQDFEVDKTSYYLLAFSLIWLFSDLITHLTFAGPRAMKWAVRTIGAVFVVVNYGYLLLSGDSFVAATGFAIYTILFLLISLLYRQPELLYTFTATLPLFVTFFIRELGFTKWIHPVIFIAVLYYALGFVTRLTQSKKGWDRPLIFSGLGLGTFVAIIWPIFGGLDAAIPVAVAATLWAVEAFARKDAWYAFPANLLYFLAYFIILTELDVDEIQFFTVGAALLGLFQHYLLIRAGSKTGAFITGMVSQLILLGTTYIQMLSTQEFIYFLVLFFQFLVVLAYGVVIRSRSLIFTPIAIIILGLMTVLYSQFKGLGTVTLIGCTGIIMLIFGIIAVLMRERITKFGERLSSWAA